MGEYAELTLESMERNNFLPLFENEIEFQMNAKHISEARKELYDGIPRWHTEEGEILKVEDMTTFHIKNCIAKLEREERKPYPPLQEELDKRTKNAESIFKKLGI